MQFDHAKFKSLVHYVIGRAGDREGFEATKLYKVLWFSEARAFVLSHQPICGETYIRAELGPFPKHAPEILLELEREGTIRVLGDRNVDSPALLFKALQNPDASTLTDDHRKIVEYAIGRVDADHTAISPGEASHDAAWEIAKLGEEIPYFALLAIRMREPRGRELEWAKSRTEDLGTIQVRGVIEDSRASRAVDDAKLRWPRADDAWNAVTWVLARDPEIGMPLNESGTTRAFTLDGARSIGLPTVTVVYVFDPNTVVIRDVLFEEATYGQSGLA